MFNMKHNIVSNQVDSFLKELGIKEDRKESFYPLSYLILKNKVVNKLDVIIVDDMEDLTTEYVLSFLKQHKIEEVEDAFAQDLEAPLAGALFAVGKTCIIFISKNQEPDSRKLFTLAHELGHYYIQSFEPSQLLMSSTPKLFNRDILGKVKRDSDGNLTAHGYAEFKANQFAAELLMPQSMVLRIHKELKKKKKLNYFEDLLIEKMMKAFGVSHTAAKIRVLDLELTS